MKLKTVLKTFFIFTTVSLVLFANQNCAPVFDAYHSEADFSSASSSSLVLFQSAQKILLDNCVACHNSGVNLNFSSTQEYIQAGLVVAGNPDASKLIVRLKNYTGAGNQLANMPPSGQLSDSDYQTLRRWIFEMGAKNVGPFVCNPQNDSLKEMDTSKLNLLSNTQYRNTVFDLLGRVLPAQQSDVFNTTVSTVILPEDSGRYPRMNSQLDTYKLKAFFDIAQKFADEITGKYYSTFVTNVVNLNQSQCSSVNPSSLSDVCKLQLIRNLGLLFYRRPLLESVESNEVGDYQQEFSVASDSVTAVNNLIFRFMMSQNFLYRIENQGVLSPTDSSVMQLSSYSIINRLSYSFWNSMPDAQLFQMAKELDLQNSANFNSAVNYVLSSPRINSTLREFAEGWLLLDKTPILNPNTSSFQYYNEGVVFDDRMRSEMINEAKELVAYTVASGGKLEDIFTTNISFARYAPLMQVYGVSTPAPQNINSGNAVRLPANRAGILTRAAMLIDGTGKQHIIHRSVRIKRDLLCISQASPPADTEPPVPMTDQQFATYTTREQVAHNTGSGACLSCHQSINPWGYALTGYNGLGFFKLTEPGIQRNGQLTGVDLNIDTQADLSGLVSGGRPIRDGVDMSSFVGTRPETQSCFALNYSEYFNSRGNNLAKDGCHLNNMVGIIKNGGSVKDAISARAYSEDFRYKKMD